MTTNVQESFRNETDSLGNVTVPSWAYWGAQTQRAVENFSVSDLRIPIRLIRALGIVKEVAAEVNHSLGLIEKPLADAIRQAAREMAEGKWNNHFPIDVFQTGSGTSWNMNANEVIANRANETLGSPLGSKKPVHPNDHVNRGQSSNDVIPTVISMADREEAGETARALGKLQESLERKSLQFADVLKIGRTHLQDAVPMTLGQELSGYARQIEKGRELLERCFHNLEELAIGGTAIGTGLNAHPDFAERVVAGISKRTGIPFREAKNKFEAIGARDSQVELMGALTTVAVSLTKIANDLRLLGSGPRTGLAEIVLPALQPGSSIMPGKVNPVILEMTIQAAAHVMGSSLSVTMAGQTGPLELNMMQPIIAWETLSSLSLIGRTATVLAEKCIDGIEADVEKSREWIERSLALVTPLTLRVGYDKAAKLAQKALKENRTIREIVVAEGVLTADEADKLLDPRAMIGPEG
ncbi:MAG TPA: class II fumarate hydratase [Spirochaetia bacterium]|nr:class II fumarate hydratase [Spirochaetia bacterium]